MSEFMFTNSLQKTTRGHISNRGMVACTILQGLNEYDKVIFSLKFRITSKAELWTRPNVFFQIKNDELTRIQNELEQEVDGFRKLKKLIQEHGLPNHDQLIMLQQQVINLTRTYFSDGDLTQQE